MLRRWTLTHKAMLDKENITFIIAVLAAIFAVYSYFRKPQEDIEKQQIKTDEDLKDKASIISQKEIESKAIILSEQFKWNMNETERKFADFAVRLDKSYELATNHTHTVDVKVDHLIATVTHMGNEITRLSTIIEERIPKKQ